MGDALEQLRVVAAGQDGQFATAQATMLGVGRHQLAGMRKHREIATLRYGVARFCATPGPADPAVTAALACWPDGVISHRSAAAHHGLRRVALPREPDVTVPHGQVRKLPGIAVHWTRAMDPCDVLHVGGVAYMSLARTVVDLADPADPWETLATLDDAMALGAKRSWVHSRAKALANGRGGVVLVREATSKAAAAEFRSWLEREAAHVYRAGGLPDPEWNVPVYDDDGLIGVVDAIWPTWRVVSEKEGLRFHTSPRQRRLDAQRFNRLQDARHAPRRFTWEDIVHRPVDVVATLYRALRAAGADLDPARIPRRIDVLGRPFLPGG